MFNSAVMLCCLLAILNSSLGKSTLANVADEVKQLEQELVKLEGHDVGVKENNVEDFSAAKRELEDAVNSKKNSVASFDSQIRRLKAAKKELQKLAMEKLLMEEDPVEEKKPISQEKKEVYDLMRKVMENHKVSEDEQDMDTQGCNDLRNDCASLASRCDSHPGMRRDCRRTCGYCLYCKDESPQCSKAVAKCHGTRADLMKTFCNDTCGYCKTPAPKPCGESTFGCCWDRETEMKDSIGSNCPQCMDDYSSHLCGEFQPDCLDDNISGEFMRKYCPVSCKLCGASKKCFDSPGLEDKCKFWGKNQWCKLRPSVMNFHCRLTCKLC